jgi:hypothetical protein
MDNIVELIRARREPSKRKYKITIKVRLAPEAAMGKRV